MTKPVNGIMDAALYVEMIGGHEGARDARDRRKRIVGRELEARERKAALKYRAEMKKVDKAMTLAVSQGITSGVAMAGSAVASGLAGIASSAVTIAVEQTMGREIADLERRVGLAEMRAERLRAQADDQKLDVDGQAQHATKMQEASSRVSEKMLEMAKKIA